MINVYSGPNSQQVRLSDIENGPTVCIVGICLSPWETYLNFFIDLGHFVISKKLFKSFQQILL